MIIWEGIEYNNYIFDRLTNKVISKRTGKELSLNVNNKGYKMYSFYLNNKQKMVAYHRLIYYMFHPIINFNNKILIDHIDRNSNNNSVYNLRVCSHRQNLMNKNKKQNTSSIYFGVYWCKINNKWKTQIRLDSKTKKTIGFFNEEIDAAKSYNSYIITNNLNDGFRRLNIVPNKKQLTITKKNKVIKLNKL